MALPSSSHSSRRPVPATALASLLGHARRHAPLTREQERELLKLWQTERDQRAANQLVAATLRHVVTVAMRYRSYKVPLDVLISEGNLGLVRAMDKFDLAQETRFSTYATYWIRYHIIDHIMRSWSVVGGGTGALRTRTFFRLRRERARAWSQFGEGEHAERVLAERLEMSQSKLTRLLRQIDQRDLSLSLPAHDDSNVTLLDTLPSEASQYHDLEKGQLLARVKPVLDQAIAQLSERERLILQKRIMADGEEEETLSDLGATLSISRERVRQLEQAVKRKLQTYIVQRLPKDDYCGAAA